MEREVGRKAYFRKSKKACWKLMQGTEAFVTTFAKLGASSNPMNYVIWGIERFTCALFGEKRLSSVDNIRRKNFWSKITDLTLQPPCKNSLLRYIKRSR